MRRLDQRPPGREAGLAGAEEGWGSVDIAGLRLASVGQMSENLRSPARLNNPRKALQRLLHGGLMDCVTSNAGSGQPLTNQRPQGYSPLSACGPLWWFPRGVLFIFGFCAGPAFARPFIVISFETLDEATGSGM